ENREPRTENREPRTENREPRTENREPRTENREPRTENREPRTLKLVPHLGPLGLQVLGVVLVWLEFDRALFHNMELVALKADHLLRVVRHESDAAHAEVK